MLIMKKKPWHSGITLVEVLVAAGVLSLLLGFGYKIFFGMSASFQKGSWALATRTVYATVLLLSEKKCRRLHTVLTCA